MTEQAHDPTTVPYWEAAMRGDLLIQKCEHCGRHQFYPRPFCVRCEGDPVRWVRASGLGTVHSVTTVRIQVEERLVPPYAVGIVELDEGPRMLSVVEPLDVSIGARVRVTWRSQEDGRPVPVFLSEAGQ